MAAPIIGLDIGGSKVAGAAYDAGGAELEKVMLPTPSSYEELLDCCRAIVGQLEQKNGRADSIGVCAPYSDAILNANIPFMIGKALPQDLEKIFGRPVPLGNDANLAAYAEAMDGAGRGYRAVLGLIMGTGVGGGFVF